MRLPSLRRVAITSNVSATELTRIFLQFVDNLAASLEPLLANPRSQGSVQSVTLVAATSKVVNHMVTVPVGKTPNGWAVTDINAAATVRRADWDETTITLVASANCTIQLEVW